MNKVACIIVSYNPDRGIEKCFNSLINQVDKMFIVDNGSNGDRIKILKELKNSNANKVDLILNNENLGIATALNVGIKKALNEGYDWVITMDQDSKANDNMIEKMFEVYEGINLDELLKLIEENLPYKMKKCEYLIPYDRSDMNSFLHRNGRVLEEEYREDGTFMIVEVDDESYNKTKDYIINILM